LEIQIFGVKKCSDSNKAERYFKERRIQFQYRDLTIKGVSKKELDDILRFYSPEDVINKQGKRYRERNLEFIKHDIIEELLGDPLLIRTPVVRFKNLVTIGYTPEIWQKSLLKI
jgi:arsenate reductase-like glutaredoxin family protein